MPRVHTGLELRSCPLLTWVQRP